MIPQNMWSKCIFNVPTLMNRCFLVDETAKCALYPTGMVNPTLSSNRCVGVRVAPRDIPLFEDHPFACLFFFFLTGVIPSLSCQCTSQLVDLLSFSAVLPQFLHRGLHFTSPPSFMILLCANVDLHILLPHDIVQQRYIRFYLLSSVTKFHSVLHIIYYVLHHRTLRCSPIYVPVNYGCTPHISDIR